MSKRQEKDVYAYPAILRTDCDDDNAVLVTFPDLENCFADGINMAQALEEAREALGNVLYWMEKDGNPIPKPSDIRDVQISGDEIKSLVAADMAEVRKAWDNRCVSRTVTLPAWLDSMAKKEQVNFSQTLQYALKNILKVDEKNTQTA